MHLNWTDFILMKHKGNTLGACDGSVDTVNLLKPAVFGFLSLGSVHHIDETETQTGTLAVNTNGK